MRNWKLLFIGIALLAAGALCVVQAQAQTISGTAHDLSTGYGTDQICIFCHTPHNASTTNNTPLWNHGVTAQSFTPYASTTLNATVGDPGDTSIACLSCHDGTVAIDAYGGSSGTTSMTGDSLLDTDLSNDHPIGFTYDAALATADTGLHTPPITGLPLFSGQVECGTCHNVHNNAYIPFLRETNAASALCLSCHDK